MPTQSQKLAVKLFLTPDSHVELEEIVPVFHGWIQRQAVPEHLLVDVANYAHAADGPGIALVSLQGNFLFDRLGGRPDRRALFLRRWD